MWVKGGPKSFLHEWLKEPGSFKTWTEGMIQERRKAIRRREIKFVLCSDRTGLMDRTPKKTDF
jgi:hypothetical protein